MPGKYIDAEDAVIYVDGVPVMYLPKYHRSLERHLNNFAFLPGYRTPEQIEIDEARHSTGI